MLDSNFIELQDKIEPIIVSCGLELIELTINKCTGRCMVRCLVDHGQGGVTVQECTALNRKIFSFLDESKILGDDFIVEVNSPGIDRPLRTHKDFLRVIGRTICLWLHEPVGGKSYVEGELCSVSKEELTLRNMEEFYRIDINTIKTAKERVEL
ncbi:MAG: hypothetical protein WCI77_08180 [Candidatus Omnitrophota bacterium]